MQLKFVHFMICVYLCPFYCGPPRPIRVNEHKQLFSQTQKPDGHDCYLSYYFDVFACSLSVGGEKGILSEPFVLFKLKLKWLLSAQNHCSKCAFSQRSFKILLQISISSKSFYINVNKTISEALITNNSMILKGTNVFWQQASGWRCATCSVNQYWCKWQNVFNGKFMNSNVEQTL